MTIALPPSIERGAPRLTDRFGRTHTYLRISVTDRCNLRCVYCMPKEGLAWTPDETLLSVDEIVRVARIFVAQGVTKIRLTGGEPTVRPDLDALIERLAALEGVRSLLMTTNGMTLRRKARNYQQLGLNGLNISLDTLKAGRFQKITRRDGFAETMHGIEAALSAGFDSVKINVVVMAGVNEDEILDFVHFVRDKPLNVRFIEFMPFKNNEWREGKMISYAEIRTQIERHYPLRPIRQEAGDVAKDFAIEGFRGTVSFITSMTDSFCGTCNRLRLTAEGSIKPCLFSHAEVSLREDLRSGVPDRIIAGKIRQAVLLKQEGHAAMRDLPGLENRSMIQIGG